MRGAIKLWLVAASLVIGAASSHESCTTRTSSLAMKPLQIPLISSIFAAHSALCCFPEQCAGFAEVLASQLPDSTTIHSSDFIAAGTNLSLPSTHPTCNAFSSVVSYNFCRITMRSQTGPSSGVEIEAWLPHNWTGRFLEVGNGGLGGCLAHSDINYGAERRFAVIGTDNGHTGNIGAPFLDNPGVLEDYAYRAIHTGAVLGKQTVEAFYGKKHTKAYFLGCSTGGRQGFMEAQNFPDDFDGIVAGAPAFAFNSLIAWGGYAYTITGPPGSPTFLSEELWAVVLEDILSQCDGLDGHVDGVIEDTNLCQYKPEGLLCPPGETGSVCLTGQQADTVRKIFSPLYDDRGELVYPRMQPGADSSTRLWRGAIFPYALDWFRYVVHGDASWNGTIGLPELQAMRNVETFGVDAFDGDLSAARAANTKIIHYHGLQDELISSDNSDRYYGLVARTLGMPPTDLDTFYRYFRVSGMAHCTGGTGAFNIGNRPASLAGERAEENVLAAMVSWVEEGKAPEHVLGTAFDEDGMVKFKRRHCRYPRRNVYGGKGDPDLAESWGCV